MPELRIVHQRSDGSEISNDLVTTWYELTGYWKRNATLRGNQYNASEYTHNWMFVAYEKTGNYFGSGFPNPTMYTGAVGGRNNDPYLGDDSTYGLGTVVSLFIWNNERWTFFFRVANVSGVHYYVYYHGGGADGGGTGQNTAVFGSGFHFQGNGFSRTGYSFSHWEVYDAGGGHFGNYSAGQHYGNWNRKNNANAHARWSANHYTVSYHGDGNTGGSTGNNTAVYDHSFHFQGNGFNRTGYSFAHWAVYDPWGNHIGNYASGQHYGNWNRTHGVNAYARWNINSYDVNFYNNGKGTGVLITQNYNTTITCPSIKAVGYVFGGWATSAASTTVNKAGGSTFTLGAAGENYYAIWTENTNGRILFSELQTVFGGTNPIYISEYRTQSGQTTANSRITLSANFKGKG
jgi:hypothetical protein